MQQDAHGYNSIARWESQTRKNILTRHEERYCTAVVAILKKEENVELRVATRAMAELGLPIGHDAGGMVNPLRS